MANPVAGEVSLDIEGVGSFKLALSFGARVAAEEKDGRPFHEIIDRAAKGYESAILVIVWAALQKHHPDMEIADVTELLDQHAAEFRVAIERAADASAPEGNAPAPKAKSPRGRSSGRSGAKRG